MGDDDCRRLEATISRLALELAEERKDHATTRAELDAARRQARTWRRVSEWIFTSRNENGDSHGHQAGTQGQDRGPRG